MVFLHIEYPTTDQFLFINSPGGWIVPGMAIYDMMQSIKPDVHTSCLGLAASIASCILMGGTPTKRLAFPHSRVMIHQPASSYFNTKAGEVVLETDELTKIRENVVNIYVQRTGKPPEVISEDLDRDVFMSPEEAKAYGIVDLIAFDEVLYTNEDEDGLCTNQDGLYINP